MKKIILAVLAFLIIGGGIFLAKGYVDKSQKSEKSQESQLQKVRIVAIKDAGDTNVMLEYAKEKGFFAEQGIEVETIEMDRTPFEAVISGNAEALFGGISRPLTSYFNGVESRVILNGFHPFGIFAVSRFPKGQEADIRKVAINSVKGENQQMAQLVLENLGVDPAKVEYIAAPTVASKLSMMQQGQADLNVFSTRKIYDDNPELANLTLYGSEVTQKNSQLVRSLVTTQKVIDEKGAQLKSMVVGLRSAIEDAQKNKASFVDFLKRKYQYNDIQATEIYDQFMTAREGVDFVPTSDLREGVINEAKKDASDPGRDINGFIYSNFAK